jgi:hypothetical protein
VHERTAARNLTVLRRIALNLLPANTIKGSLRGKRKTAACNDNHMASLLRGRYPMCLPWLDQMHDRNGGGSVGESRSPVPDGWFRHVHGFGLVAAPHPRFDRRDGTRAGDGVDARRARGSSQRGRYRCRPQVGVDPDKLDTARKLLAAGDKPPKVAKLLQAGRTNPADAGA